MAVDLFSPPVFLLVFRETLETSIIVSVLLAFLKQTLGGPDRDAKVYHALRRQVRSHPLFAPGIRAAETAMF
jgi:high-affinity iron transporter